MRTIETMTNTGGITMQSHTLEIPPCCPVSQNPRPGSTLTITYSPDEKKLEVGSLFAYIHQYKDGLKDDDGKVQVRDMEGMIARIAQDCSEVLEVQVEVEAMLNIVPKQVLNIRARGK